MDAMKLHQQPHLMYEYIQKLDETGLRLTCNSGSQKLLAVEGSKRVPTATHREKGETVTVVAFMG
jgi:hypothetical protein